MGKTLLKIELEKDDNITISSDLRKVDSRDAGTGELKAAFFSYVPAFCAEFRSIPVKVSFLTSMLSVIFLAAAMAISDNGEAMMEQFNKTYREFRKGRDVLLKAEKK